MADFAASFVPTTVPLISSIDPFTFIATFAPAVNDGAPPRLFQVDPPQGPLGKFEPLRFRLVDDTGWSLVELWLGFGTKPSAYELVWTYEDDEFRGSYASGSSRSVVTGGWDFVIQRGNGWPYQTQVRLRASVVDRGGNLVLIDL